MRLQDIYATNSFASRPGDDTGTGFDMAYTTARRRSHELAPEDRTLKLGKLLYAGLCELTPQGVSPDQLATLPAADIVREAGSNHSYALTDTSFRHLAEMAGPSNGERINFPAYLKACDERLRILNLNAWLQKARAHTAFVRTVQPNGIPLIRGILSERYVPIDDHDLLEVLATVPGIAEATVRWFYFGEDSTHLRLTWRQDRREIRTGDVVEFGVHISNSEIGKRAIRIEPVVYRLVCSNGLIAPSKGGDGSWYIRHVGNPQRVRSAVTEAVHGALPAAQEMAAKLRRAVDEAVEKPVETLKALALEENLTEAMLNAAVEELLGNVRGTATRYDLINSLTGAAREQAEPDRRYDLERIGAKYLDSPLPVPVAA